ncbi:MAG: macro domain-containing protein [Candidatus Syntropharchaeia archaeon]
MMEMNEGIAAIVKEKGGREIEEEAMSKIPVETGEAIVTSAGALNATHVIHAVAVYPDLTADENTIEKATENSLLAAENLKIKSMAFRLFLALHAHHYRRLGTYPLEKK